MTATTLQGSAIIDSARSDQRRSNAWALTCTDQAAYQTEQEELGHATWTLIGLTNDVARSGDWITASIGCRSVFVQRFDNRLVGFENVCVHRFYPLRTDKQGNGPIRCGFHGWMYNESGVPVGIPLCKELFGCERHEIGRRLTPIEVDVCGALIFGRLAAPPAADSTRPTLAEYLGKLASPLMRMTAGAEIVGVFEMQIAANWKYCYHMTLDDYHIVAVHSKSLGSRGYTKEGTYRYFPLGQHSAMIASEREVPEDALDVFIDAYSRGKILPGQYKIFQAFPDLIVALAPAAVAPGGLVNVSRYVATAANATLMRTWILKPAIPGDPAISEGDKANSVHFLQRIADEDRMVAEGLQLAARQSTGAPLLGRQETRIAWFNETYFRFMNR
jgi:phenylpropionate dioxygenase-like ring-hydroxylating dioxygenase large terminal subunit